MVSGSRTLSNPVVSPDGTWVAYQGRDGERRGVFVSPVAGGTEVRASPSAVDGIHPAWSPSGREIFYVAIRDGMHTVEEVGFDAGQVSAPRLVMAAPVTAIRPCVSPDDRRLAVVGAEAEASEVWVADLGAPPPSLRRLTRGSQAIDVSWLDDHQLAVSGLWGGTRWQLKIVTIEGATRDLSPHLDLGSAEGGGTFEVARGAGIVVLSRTEPTGDLWLIEEDRGKPDGASRGKTGTR